jgi:hypothetical protein
MFDPPSISSLDDCTIISIMEVLSLQGDYRALSSLSLVSKRFHTLCRSRLNAGFEPRDILMDTIPIEIEVWNVDSKVLLWGRPISLPHYPPWLNRLGFPISVPLEGVVGTANSVWNSSASMPEPLHLSRSGWYPHPPRRGEYHLIESPDRDEWRREGLLPSRFTTRLLMWESNGVKYCEENLYQHSRSLSEGGIEPQSPSGPRHQDATPLLSHSDDERVESCSICKWLTPRVYNAIWSGEERELAIWRYWYSRGFNDNKNPSDPSLEISARLKEWHLYGERHRSWLMPAVVRMQLRDESALNWIPMWRRLSPDDDGEPFLYYYAGRRYNLNAAIALLSICPILTLLLCR